MAHEGGRPKKQQTGNPSSPATPRASDLSWIEVGLSKQSERDYGHNFTLAKTKSPRKPMFSWPKSKLVSNWGTKQLNEVSGLCRAEFLSGDAPNLHLCCEGCSETTVVHAHLVSRGSSMSTVLQNTSSQALPLILYIYIYTFLPTHHCVLLPACLILISRIHLNLYLQKTSTWSSKHYSPLWLWVCSDTAVGSQKSFHDCHGHVHDPKSHPFTRLL